MAVFFNIFFLYISLLTLLMTVSTELWLSLEEHQYALELIMGRYRKQMLQLMMAKKELDTKPVLSLHEDHAKVHQLSRRFFLQFSVNRYVRTPSYCLYS